MLENALGGNSKTIMICSLSPASNNYEETLSTLRYADRAKQIKNKAVVNMTEQEKLIMSLQEEITKMKAQLEGKDLSGGGDAAEVDELRHQLQDSQKQMQDRELTWQEKLEEAQREAALHQKEEGTDIDQIKQKAHVININEDQMLDRKQAYGFEEGEQLTVGRKNATPAA